MWDSWGSWSSCNKTCGVGSRERQRSFTAALLGGKPCEGCDTDYEDCNIEECTGERFNQIFKMVLVKNSIHIMDGA